MRRMFQVVSTIAVLAMAVPAAAQQTATVQIDFPGAAAVEAGMSDPKPVEKDAEGRRRAAIAVPVGSEGTVYGMTRPDGTIVVRLVSDGQPAPAGFKDCGRFRAGQNLTFNPGTFTVTPGSAGGSTVSTRGTNQWPYQSRFLLDVRGGIGTGSFLDVVDTNCAEIENDLGLNCSGKDRGRTWLFGVGGRITISELYDLGLRVDYLEPSDITFTSTGTFDGLQISSDARGSGHIWNFSGEVGISPTPRFRIYGGGRLSPFSLKTTQTLTILNQTDTETQDYSGVGRGIYIGVGLPLTSNLSVFGETGRTWLKDSSVDADDEEFDEAFSAWILGVHWTFRALRGSR